MNCLIPTRDQGKRINTKAARASAGTQRCYAGKGTKPSARHLKQQLAAGHTSTRVLGYGFLVLDKRSNLRTHYVCACEYALRTPKQGETSSVHKKKEVPAPINKPTCINPTTRLLVQPKKTVVQIMRPHVDTTSAQAHPTGSHSTNTSTHKTVEQLVTAYAADTLHTLCTAS